MGHDRVSVGQLIHANHDIYFFTFNESGHCEARLPGQGSRSLVTAFLQLSAGNGQIIPRWERDGYNSRHRTEHQSGEQKCDVI